MKKMILSFVVAIVAATTMFAQSSMLATLSHNGNISTFYGASALREAHVAAVDGDVITLSSGSFNAVNIEKSLTIRGAGMSIDNTTQTEPTILMGDFSIAIPKDATGRLSIEGIYHAHSITISGIFNNGTFLKCRFGNIVCSGTEDAAKNLTMIHCRQTGSIAMSKLSTVAFVNCIVRYPCVIDYNGISMYDFTNCIILRDRYDDMYFGQHSIKNSILCYNSTDNTQSGYWNEWDQLNSVAYNNIGIGWSRLFDLIPNTTNKISNFDEIFKSFRGIYNDDENFELTETAKNTYTGLDGTEVGIYGGNMPFSSTPTNPQITKCNVAAKSTADGKLSVDITVNGAE